MNPLLIYEIVCAARQYNARLHIYYYDKTHMVVNPSIYDTVTHPRHSVGECVILGYLYGSEDYPHQFVFHASSIASIRIMSSRKERINL